jgi:hypothetical protein
MNGMDRPSQESDALANMLPYYTIPGADMSAIFEPNHDNASEGLAPTVGADVHIGPGPQHDDEQMDDTDIENFFNLNLASEDLDPDTQAANRVLNNAATSMPAIPTSLPNISVPLASVSNVAPIAIVPTVTAVAAVVPRVRCTVCGKPFGRTSDLNRHALKHNPNARRYPCPHPGCRLSSSNVRKDKLEEHRRRHGH